MKLAQLLHGMLSWRRECLCFALRCSSSSQRKQCWVACCISTTHPPGWVLFTKPEEPHSIQHGLAQTLGVCFSSPGIMTMPVCALDHPGGLQNHPRLRTPPPPLSHAHTPNQHHAASINSLNRGNFTPRSNPSPAPTDHSLSGEPPTSGGAPPEPPAHAQDNWLLNSNIPLETRCGPYVRLRGGDGEQQGQGVEVAELSATGPQAQGLGYTGKGIVGWVLKQQSLEPQSALLVSCQPKVGPWSGCPLEPSGPPSLVYTEQCC